MLVMQLNDHGQGRFLMDKMWLIVRANDSQESQGIGILEYVLVNTFSNQKGYPSSTTKAHYLA